MIARGEGARPVGSAFRTARFARAVAERHRRCTGRPALLRDVLLRRALPREAAARVGVVVAPRVELVLRSPDRAPAAVAASAAVRIIERTTVSATRRQVQTSPQVAVPETGSRAVDVVRRLLERRERVELDFGGRGGSQAAEVGRRSVGDGRTGVPLPASGLPLELVPVRTAIREPAATVTTAPPLESWGSPPSSASKEPDPPKLDVESLTDQVMRSIDRRLIAYRERTGRV
jgi:hypothetical protein